MSTPEPLPIPSSIWERILAFLHGVKTGKITLVVLEGRVVDCAIEERIRAHRKTR